MSRVKNELSGRAKQDATKGPFRLMTILIIFLISVFGFAAATVMSGYAKDLEPKDRRGAHAQSQSAIGYAGVRQLASASGRQAKVLRQVDLDWDQKNDVRIFTLDRPFDLSKLDDYALSAGPTLVVLPKWDVVPLNADEGRPSKVWVERPLRRNGLYSISRIGRSGRDAPHKFWIAREDGKSAHTINSGLELEGRTVEIDSLQYLGLANPDEETTLNDLSIEEAIEQIEELTENSGEADEADGSEASGDEASPDIKNRRTDSDVDSTFSTDATETRLSANADEGGALGLTVALSIDDKPVLFAVREWGEVQYHVLTEPDLLNTQGLSSPERAELALAILDHMRAYTENEFIEDADVAVLFDLTLHGYGTNTNIIKTLTQPPFLAATLCLLAAIALVIWRGFVRFGDPRPEVSGLTLGKRTLIENGARLIRLARRPTAISSDYVKLQERRLVSALRLGGARGERVQAVIRAREAALSPTEDSGRFEMAASQVEAATDAPLLVRAARDLHDTREQLSSPG